MATFKPTHSGQLYGDARTDGKLHPVLLRETKNFYVTKNRTKFRKDSGHSPYTGSWPGMWSLLIETVKPIGEQP